MSYIFRLIKIFWITSIDSELEYQFNIIVELVSVVGNLIGSLFVLSLFYSSGNTLGGWQWEHAIVVLGIYTLLEGLTISLLQPNLSRIVRHVQNGTLDFVLLKPIDSQLWLSLRMISPWGFPSFLVGVLLITYGVISSGATLSIYIYISSFITLLSSFIILYSLWFVISTTSIWFVKVWNANEVLRSTLVAGRFPITSYPSSLRTIFTFLLPIAFLTTIPAEALLGTVSIYWILCSMIIASSFLLISFRFWKYALRFYTSASS